MAHFLPRSFPCGRLEAITDRRQLLARAGAGMGMLALADLCRAESPPVDDAASANPLTPRPSHFPAKAQAVIWLFMEGAPSAVDIFDPKPELTAATA